MVDRAWTEAFDRAFLGAVEEGEALAVGFGGIVRRATWAGNQVVTKQMYRDPDDQELFKAFLGVLIPSSPCLGYGVMDVNGLDHTRLISAYVPHTARDRLVPELDIAGRLRMAKGMITAISFLSQLNLVHCDVKPDNFLVSEAETVFIIDLGSISRSGEDPPMSCEPYRPPDTIVSIAWDVFSLGKVFCEVSWWNHGASPDIPPAILQLIVDDMTQSGPSAWPCLSECLSRLT